MIRTLSIFVLVLLPFTGFAQSKLEFSEKFDYSTGYCPGDPQYDNWIGLLQLLDTTADKFVKMTMKGTYDMTGKTCSDKQAVRQIADALYNGYDASIPCDGEIWQVGTGCSDRNCGSKSDYIELTLNQYTCNCGTSYTIRPGMTSPNWGGINTETCQWWAQNANQTMTLEVYRIYGNDNLNLVSFRQPDACTYKQDLYLNISNYGVNTVNDFYIGYSVNGVVQTPVYINKSLNSDETNAFMVASGFVFSANTQYDFEFWTYDPNGVADSEQGNDTIRVSYTHTGTPDDAIGKTFVNCGVGRVDITAKSNDYLAWYNEPTGGKMLSFGNDYTTPFLYRTDTFYAEAMSFKSKPDQLSTGYHNYSVVSWDPNNYNGAMFKVRANDMVRLTGLTVQNVMGNSNPYYRVYIREGGFQGYERDSSTWTCLFNGRLSSNSQYNTIPLEQILRSGVNYGLYVTTDPRGGEDVWINYGTNSYSNSDISMEGGNFVYGLFDQVRTPFTLDCDLIYEKACVSQSRAEVPVVINPKPFGSTLIPHTGFQGKYDMGLLNKPDISEVGKTIEYQLTAPQGYDNNDYDATWTVNSVKVYTEYGSTPISQTDYSYSAPSSGNNGIVAINTKSYMLDSNLRIVISISDKGPYFCDTILSRILHVAPTPRPLFKIPSIICQNEDVILDNVSTVHSGNLEYRWKLSNGDTSDFVQPVFNFPTPGNYWVRLTAITKPYGIEKDTLVNFTVGTVPVNKFKVDNACYGTDIQFTNQTAGTGIVHTWNFGDNTAQTNQISPSHRYAQAGTYQVKLTSDLNGCKAVYQRVAHVFNRPVAAFNITNPSVCSNEEAKFENTSAISGNSLLGAYWSFGDGNFNSGYEPSHEYGTAGNYTVQLRAVSEFGCSDSITKTLTVKQAPTASFSYNKLCNFESTSFVNTSTEFSGMNSIYQWISGDGKTTTTKNYTRNWSNYGPQTMKLVANLSNGCKDEITKNIEILKQAKADFRVNDICSGDQAVFANNSTSDDGNMTYRWFFGDTSSPSTASNPVHKYVVANSTTFSVALVVKVPGGCDDTLVKQVTVTATPTCDFNVAPNNNIGFNTYRFTPVNGDYDSYEWMFGDGGSSSQEVADYKYLTTGSYNVSLSVKDGECECKMTKKVNITPTSVNSLFNSGISLYPNPADQSVKVKLDNGGKAEVRIINHLGQVVLQAGVEESGEISLTDLSSGIYTVEIESNGVKTQVKLSIVH